ncbi:MAG TPA: LLM class flavin-dependent oxidoreductase [Acidimicrobiales bacterium]|jgi:hypothetical protein|nr:LLM class flavin-dependent oxidoreductase [Acidimicrobiales bacterium]
MRFGFVLPGGTAQEQLEQAALADRSGWDAVFVWEAAFGIDAWSLLAAMSQRTERVQLGTMLTPLPWRRPWKVASQAATLDQLSGGRAIVAVGLGAPDPSLGEVGEPVDKKERAALLDDGIDIMTKLWAGDGRHEGARYDIDFTNADRLLDVGKPAGRERVPIWCVGAWPFEKSMRRILRCDGLLPYAPGQDLTPEIVRQMITWLDDHGGRRPGFDVVQEGETPGDDPVKAREIVTPWADAGATWWLEAHWMIEGDADHRRKVVTERIEAGPPPVS